MRGRWVHLGSPWGSLGFSDVVGLTRIHPECRWVHVWSLNSLGFALGDVVFIPLRWVHKGSRWDRWVDLGSLCSIGFALGVVGFIRSRRVHSDSLCGSLGSL